MSIFTDLAERLDVSQRSNTSERDTSPDRPSARTTVDDLMPETRWDPYAPWMTAHANRIADQERGRYQAGLHTATTAYEDARSVLSQGIDTDLAFSKAADSVGAQSKRLIESLRSSLGARGLRMGSGAAQGSLSRLAQGIQGSLTGARRDIALEDQRTRQSNAAINFANAMNLAGYQNSPVSGIQYENAQNIYEGYLARLGLQSQERMVSDANSFQWTDLLSAAPVVGSLLG